MPHIKGEVSRWKPWYITIKHTNEESKEEESKDPQYHVCWSREKKLHKSTRKRWLLLTTCYDKSTIINCAIWEEPVNLHQVIIAFNIVTLNTTSMFTHNVASFIFYFFPVCWQVAHYGIGSGETSYIFFHLYIYNGWWKVNKNVQNVFPKVMNTFLSWLTLILHSSTHLYNLCSK